jgi:hypothetical protein
MFLNLIRRSPWLVKWGSVHINLVLVLFIPLNWYCSPVIINKHACSFVESSVSRALCLRQIGFSYELMV